MCGRGPTGEEGNPGADAEREISWVGNCCGSQGQRRAQLRAGRKQRGAATNRQTGVRRRQTRWRSY